MLQRLIQAMEDNKVYDIQRQRLALRDEEIKLLEKQNEILSKRLECSLAIVCNGTLIEAAAAATPPTSILNASLNTPNSLVVDSISYDEAGTFNLKINRFYSTFYQ